MKLSDLSDQEWFDRLSARRNAQAFDAAKLWRYYDGTQPMYHVARILAEQDNRFPPLTINWCRKYVRSIDGRSTLEGFGYVGEDTIDDQMQKIMLRNELDLKQSINNIATLVTGRSYGMVGPSPEGARVTIESPSQVAVELDAISGEARASINFWTTDSEIAQDDRAVLQLPASDGGSRLIEFEYGEAVSDKKFKWMKGPAKLQASGLIPVVPFLNQPRYGNPTSQLADLIPLVDSANFVATSMMATVLHHAMPRILAIDVAEAMFFNSDGSINREAVKAATGSMWIVPAEADEDGRPLPEDQRGPTPDIKQLPAADLRNFHETLNDLARHAAAVTDLSPTDLGFGVSDNPPSADSIDTARTERLLGIERFNRQQAAGYERLMRYGLAVEGTDPGRRLIEAKYRNVATPTKQSMGKVAVDTLNSGIADLYQARRDYGYTPTQIADMEARERNLARDPFAVSNDDAAADASGPSA